MNLNTVLVLTIDFTTHALSKKKLFETRTNRKLVTRVFPHLKLFTCFCIDLSPAALEIFASSGWSLWLPQFWLTTISRKTLWATHLLLQSVPNNGSQVTYWLMTDSSLLLLRLSGKVFSPEGALPSNHPEGQEDLSSGISRERPFYGTIHPANPSHRL